MWWLLALLLWVGTADAAELKYWEIDGPYTAANGQWGAVMATNPEAVPIFITHIEFVLAIDNGLTADLGMYLVRQHDNAVIGTGSFTLEVPNGAEFPLSRATKFSPDWITVQPGEALRFVFVGYANNATVRNFIPVAKIYYRTN